MPKLRYDGSGAKVCELFLRVLSKQDSCTVLDVYAEAAKDRVPTQEISKFMNNCVRSMLAASLIKKSGRCLDKNGVAYPIYISLRPKRGRKKVIGKGSTQ